MKKKFLIINSVHARYPDVGGYPTVVTGVGQVWKEEDVTRLYLNTLFLPRDGLG